MEESTGSRVVEAERTFRGLLILFEDGKRALYPFKLLREMMKFGISRTKRIGIQRELKGCSRGVADRALKMDVSAHGCSQAGAEGDYLVRRCKRRRRFS